MFDRLRAKLKHNYRLMRIRVGMVHRMASVIVSDLRHRIVKRYCIWRARDEETKRRVRRHFELLEMNRRKKVEKAIEDSSHVLNLSENYLAGMRDLIQAVGCTYGINGVITEVPEEQLARAPKDFKAAKNRMLINIRWLQQLCLDGYAEDGIRKLEKIEFEDFDTTSEEQSELLQIPVSLLTKVLREISVTAEQ